MIWIYNFTVGLYSYGVWLASFFNRKAKLWIEGRKGVFEQLESKLKTANRQLTHPIIWIHVASLGEFEQGRPIIEKLKEKYPAYKILLTFFSPSGFEIRKNYELVDHVFYLPQDTSKNALRFIEIVNPKLVIFVKYEFWYHYINTLQSKAIPTLLVSAIFRPGQLFFKSYGGLFKNILACFEHIFVQNEASFNLLKKHYYNNITLAGDTRVDRVSAIAQQGNKFGIIEKFVHKNKTLVCGSTWPPDEAILIDFINKTDHWKIIIAPHEIKESNIKRLLKSLPEKTIRYSKADEKSVLDQKVLVIDNIGMLSSLYRYGTVAYIGGGFGKDIHNTLEPIAFGLPVIFGPKYKKFDEASTLVENGGSFTISNSNDFITIMNQLNDENFCNNASRKANIYIEENTGATDKILDHIANII